MLESVEKFALRVCSKQWNASYSLLCSSLNLHTLAARRKQLKLVHGLADFPSAPISTRDNPFDLRSLNPHTLSGFIAKTNSFKHPFFPDAVSSGIHYHLIWLWHIELVLIVIIDH